MNTTKKRYHVINELGTILESYDLGIYGLDSAQALSDNCAPDEIRVIDSRDGSEYAACVNGEMVRGL
jgi:hypothetical protein